jgi:hypothetical protein
MEKPIMSSIKTVTYCCGLHEIDWGSSSHSSNKLGFIARIKETASLKGTGAFVFTVPCGPRNDYHSLTEIEGKEKDLIEYFFPNFDLLFKSQPLKNLKVGLGTTSLNTNEIPFTIVSHFVLYIFSVKEKEKQDIIEAHLPGAIEKRKKDGYD